MKCAPFPAPDGGTAQPVDLCTLPCESANDCLDPGLDCFPEATDGGGILVDSEPDWRWSTNWYPTARIFRQTTAGDWSHPVREAAVALRQIP